MLAVLGLLSLAFYLSNAAPLLINNNDQKLVNGQTSYQSFSLFDLPIVAKRPPPLKDAPIVANHQVKADLAVVSSAEVNPSEPEPFTGYGEAVDPAPSDMFIINAPSNTQDSAAKPIGVVPKLTGHIMSPQQAMPTDKNGAAIVNPTAYFLEGANLDKVNI